ncbi:antitoxin [Endozoicomonas gorgoniicola]|uniref:Antitoxin n=1 Tax=Endozoicomonas gorgoniicola TaxID=1234144 RepID=A0ABT3MSI4_9GAMM|nr:antitoxin [Endozoicomonas gorgoniicola]MCW7552325.1 antitoxin [Endozoicomonas gorgoniicola]
MKLTKQELQEEQEILDAFEANQLDSINDLETTRQKHQQAAANTFKKDARLNIRISSRTLRALQKMALQEGIPYQTMIAGVLYKFAEGQLVSSDN